MGRQRREGERERGGKKYVPGLLERDWREGTTDLVAVL
jgi:hypothetical protein